MPGDVLLVYLGADNPAFVVPRAAQGWTPMVASGQFLRLRQKGDARFDSYYPYYLAWVLNHSETIRQLKSIKGGSAIPFLSTANLAAFKIPWAAESVRAKVSDAYVKYLEWKWKNARERDAVETWVECAMMDTVLESSKCLEGGAHE